MNGSAAAPSRCRARPSATRPTNCAKTCSRAPLTVLKTDAAKLQMRDGVISSTEDPRKNTTFAALAKANNGLIRQTGRGTTGGERTALKQRRGRVLRRSGSRYLDRQLALRSLRLYARHRTASSIPLVSESDMVGSLMESTQVAHRTHSLGPRISGHAALQRRLSVLPASHHHGHSQSRRRCTSTVWSRAGFTA